MKGEILNIKFIKVNQNFEMFAKILGKECSKPVALPQKSSLSLSLISLQMQRASSGSSELAC